MDITDEMLHERIQKLRRDLTSKAEALATARKRVEELERERSCPALEYFKGGVCSVLQNERLRAEKAKCDRDELQEKYTRCYSELVSTAKRASLAERDLIDAQRERDDARDEIARLKGKV
jgi:hypothetical protein